MITHTKLDELMDKLQEALPESARHMHRDIKSNMRTILENGLVKLNLVSREEYDVQSSLLARMQERVRKLETQLNNLEKQK